MKKYYSPTAVRDSEKNTHLDDRTMIDMAAEALYRHIHTLSFDLSNILVFVGSGNNGADGLALGALLEKDGCKVSYYIIPSEKRSPENERRKENKESVSLHQKKNYTLFIDALFGIGFRGNLKGEELEAVEYMNSLSVPVFSIDIPSGVSASDGTVGNTAVKATATASMNFLKLGHVVYPASSYVGAVTNLDLGFRTELPPDGFSLEKEDVTFEKRALRSNKGDYGRIGIVAGSKNMAGAAYLSAKAASLMGAGLVELFTVEENRTILQTLIPEAVLHTYDENTPFEELQKALSRCDVLVCGMGLGQSPLSTRLFLDIYRELSVPAVFDADALNILAKMKPENHYKGDVIITPHPGEAARLLSREIHTVLENPVEASMKLSEQFHAVALLKDAHTVISYGNSRYINLTGNPGMAAGGMGDVLSGMVGATLFRLKDPLKAAATGAYLHGRCGDLAKIKHTEYSMTAENVLEEIENTIKELML